MSSRLQAVRFHRPERAGRLQIDLAQVVGSFGGANGFAAQIFFGTEKVGVNRLIGFAHVVVHGPGDLRVSHLFQVRDANAAAAGGAGFNEIGNGDSRQEADDGHNDHDFHERESGLTARL